MFGSGSYDRSKQRGLCPCGGFRVVEDRTGDK